MRIDGNTIPGGGIGGHGIPLPTGKVEHQPPSARPTGLDWTAHTAPPDELAQARLSAATVKPPPRQGRQAIVLPVPAIAEAYLAGATSTELAAQYGVHFNTILRRLRDAGVQLRDHNDRHNPPRKATA